MKITECSKNKDGFVLTVAIIFIIMLALLAVFVLNAGANKRIMADNVGATRARAYYRAQAGVVDAQARIRMNYTTGLVADTAHGSTGTSFTDNNYNPTPYHLDLSTNPPTLSTAAVIPAGYDVTVDISAVDKDNAGTAVNPLTGRRIIESTGQDTA